MTVKKKDIQIFADPVNQKIVELLIKNELTPFDLMKKLNKPILAVWKRVNDMENAGIIKFVRQKKKIGGPVLRIYRSSAVIFIDEDFSFLNGSIIPVASVWKDLNREIFKYIDDNNEIPNGIDPINYASLVFIKSLKIVMSKPDEILRKLSMLEESAEKGIKDIKMKGQ